MMSIQNSPSERGSGLIIILVAVVLFAALTYAVSKSSDNGKNLSQEQTRLLASEIIDSGNRFGETASRLKLSGISEAEISFEYNGNYANAGCTTEDCKIFSFDGGGLEWDTPPTGSNTGDDWIFTGDVAIQDIGTTAPELLAILPGVTEAVCHRINVLIDIEGETDASPTFGSGVAADGFVGTYNASPTTITLAEIDGKRSGCLKVPSISSDMLATSPLTTSFLYYQVLVAR